MGSTSAQLQCTWKGSTTGLSSLCPSRIRIESNCTPSACQNFIPFRALERSRRQNMTQLTRHSRVSHNHIHSAYICILYIYMYLWLWCQKTFHLPPNCGTLPRGPQLKNTARAFSLLLMEDKTPLGTSNPTKGLGSPHGQQRLGTKGSDQHLSGDFLWGSNLRTAFVTFARFKKKV